MIAGTSNGLSQGNTIATQYAQSISEDSNIDNLSQTSKTPPSPKTIHSYKLYRNGIWTKFMELTATPNQHEANDLVSMHHKNMTL